MANTPQWSAARSGLLGDTGAVDASAQINQFLGTHPMTVVYAGNSVLTPNGTGGTAWAYQLSTQDIAQPFAMSGTSVGRVVVPLLPVGNGADLIVSLCANNSGQPGSVITQTKVPAAWIQKLAAVSGVAGPSSSTPITQYTNSPLAVAQFNSLHLGPTSTVAWTFPASATGGANLTAAQTYYPTGSGGYFILAGGNSGSTFYTSVFTIAYDAAGNLSQAIPQPSMPVPNAGNTSMCTSTDPASGDVTVVIAGGSQVSGSLTNAVLTAQFNPTTGALASWTAQATLPQALQDPGMAAYNGYVYAVGGTNALSSSAVVNTAYVGQVQNGQIAAWTATSPLPVAVMQPYVAALNGFLVVFGGFNGSAFTAATYYAAINADGSLGAWQAGPAVPAATASQALPALTVGTYGVIGMENGANLAMLGVGVNGPDTGWQTATVPSPGVYPALANDGAGQFQYYGLNSSNYLTASVALTPRISVPLPATGLTNGATYHVLLQQAGSDLNNYLRTHDDFDVFAGNPTVLTRSKGSTTWTAGTSGHAAPLQVYDNTPGGQPWHIWSDNGARIGTLVWATTPDQRPLGLLDATAQPGPVLNPNFDFNMGTNYWANNNGTLVTSTTFTHGELPFSGKFTPNGVSTQAYIESNYLVTVALQQPYMASCWFYSPTGYSNCEILINWYNASGFSGGFISSATGATTSVAANTWTQLTVTGTPPTNAVYATVGVYERGTPPATAIFYASAVTIQNALGPQVSSVAQCNWSAWWPAQLGLPTGVTMLA